MADTSAATGLVVQQWDADFYKEYVAESRFGPFMAKSMNSIIQVQNDLTKKKGDSITFALVNRLTNAAVTGSNVLEGNEEDLGSRSHKVTVDQKRNAVRVPMLQDQFSAIDLRRAAKESLKTWIMEETRDDIINQLQSINGVLYADATEPQKDAWLADNADRVLFGATLSNNSSNDHSASLANIDNTSDKLTASAVSLMKRIALTADPKIRPIRTTEDKRFYVMWVNSLSFRDLKADTTITQAQREALPRNKNNPLFQGGDLEWDGVVIKELEDMGTQASAIQVGPAILTGAQAVGVGWAKTTFTKEQQFDYGDKHGVSIGEVRGVEKLVFGSGAGDTDDLKDHGMVTGWFAAVADV